MNTTAAPPSAARASISCRRAPAPQSSTTPCRWADAGGMGGAGLSLLIVTALWVSNRGVQQVLGGGPDAVPAIGWLTGLPARPSAGQAAGAGRLVERRHDVQGLGYADPMGPVQVSITVAGGKITCVTVPTYPNSNGRDQEINAYSLPVLKQETLTAQSANIDTVSGATVTSDGYIQSLQSALDTAHLA